jgi:hypothetical protein
MLLYESCYSHLNGHRHLHLFFESLNMAKLAEGTVNLPDSANRVGGIVKKV